MVICLERGADIHMAKLTPLPLTVSCFSKIQIGFTFLVPAHPGSPGKKGIKRVYVCVLVSILTIKLLSKLKQLESEQASRSLRLTERFLGRYRFGELARLPADAGLVLGEDADEVQVVLGQPGQLDRQTAAVHARTCRPAGRAAAAADLDVVAGDGGAAVRRRRVPRQTDATGVRVGDSQANRRQRNISTQRQTDRKSVSEPSS